MSGGERVLAPGAPNVGYRISDTSVTGCAPSGHGGAVPQPDFTPPTRHAGALGILLSAGEPPRPIEVLPRPLDAPVDRQRFDQCAKDRTESFHIGLDLSQFVVGNAP